MCCPLSLLSMILPLWGPGENHAPKPGPVHEGWSAPPGTWPRLRPCIMHNSSHSFQPKILINADHRNQNQICRPGPGTNVTHTHEGGTFGKSKRSAKKKLKYCYINWV